MVNLSKMEFPILRLPLLAILEVLSTMNPFALINIAILTPRTKGIIKYFLKKNHGFTLRLGILERPFITIEGTRTSWEYMITPEVSRENVVTEENLYNEHFITQWIYSEDAIGKWKELFEQIDEFLNFKEIEFSYFEMDYFPDQNQMILECFEKWNKPIRDLEIGGNDKFSSIAKRALMELKVINSLDFCSQVGDDFEMEIPKGLKYIFFEDGNWIKLDQLLQIDIPVIRIRSSKLTAPELTTFFQSWISLESHLKLRIFEIYIENHNVFDTISQHLPHENIAFSYMQNTSNGPQRIIVPNGKLIRRNNGVVGNMFVSTLKQCLYLNLIVF